MAYNRLLFHLCNYPAKLLIIHQIRQTLTMERAGVHMVTSHENEKSKYLSFHHCSAIYELVPAHCQAKPTEV